MRTTSSLRLAASWSARAAPTIPAPTLIILVTGEGFHDLHPDHLLARPTHHSALRRRWLGDRSAFRVLDGQTPKTSHLQYLPTIAQVVRVVAGNTYAHRRMG